MQTHRQSRNLEVKQQGYRYLLPRALPATAMLALAAVLAAAPDSANKAASVKSARVKAALAEAGLSKIAIDHMLGQYPHYLSWNVEKKLLPAMQSWQQKLGASFLSEFDRILTLLLTEPEEEDLKDAHLMSIGVTSPRRVRQRASMAFCQSLASMQDWPMHARGFTTAQVTFGCAQDMDIMVELMLCCQLVGLYSISATTLRHKLPYFCTFIRVNNKE